MFAQVADGHVVVVKGLLADDAQKFRLLLGLGDGGLGGLDLDAQLLALGDGFLVVGLDAFLQRGQLGLQLDELLLHGPFPRFLR